MREVLLKSKTSPVLLLDNNIWRYISDSNAVSRLKRGCVRNKVALAIAPAAINEAFRTNDLSLRRRLVNTKRMGTDTWGESTERDDILFAGIGRLRNPSGACCKNRGMGSGQPCPETNQEALNQTDQRPVQHGLPCETPDRSHGLARQSCGLSFLPDIGN